MSGKTLRILLIEAPYYTDIAAAQLQGAMAVLDAAGAETTRITVPGALEIPAAIKFSARRQLGRLCHAWLRHSWRDLALRHRL
jgi:6,7-dimethyl-8-ribityllumazine synthase